MSPVIDQCDNGHKFAKLPDHPTRKGRAQCPNCLAIGNAALRARLIAAEAALEKAESWGEAGIETMDSQTAKDYHQLKIDAGFPL